MHPVIWKEHDNSWTWSIEEGKAFEDDHKVLARDEGFATRGDAKEAMQKAWDRLIDEGKTPGRPGQLKARAATPPGDATSDGGSADENASDDKKGQLKWAVRVGDNIVAVFVTQSMARKFGKENYKSKYELLKIRCSICD